MPIYEFYCGSCHVVFNFFSRRVDTKTRPACPRCGRPKLERQVSRFATLGKSGTELSGDDAGGDFDEAKMEGLMESMSREAEGLDENDPRQMAKMMRKLHDAAGMPMDAKADEAIRRLEAGESPEKIEEELGDVFGEAGPDADAVSAGPRRKARRRPPAVDETLYDL
jgi:putative FmdB family regulatory protein